MRAAEGFVIWRRVKIVVQQMRTGLFLKRPAIWVRVREQAWVFRNAAAAINFCISLGIQDVQLVRFTDDWEEDGRLEPFGERGLDLGGREMIAELRKGIEENRALKEKQRELKAELDRVAAEAKERKKQFPFKRKKIGEGETGTV